MAMSGPPRGEADQAPPPPIDESAFEEASRRDTLRTIAPGTVGTRVVIRECGNVSPRKRSAPGR